MTRWWCGTEEEAEEEKDKKNYLKKLGLLLRHFCKKYSENSK
jgi:hypothetical protein